MEPVEQFFNEWVREGIPVDQGPRFADLSREQVAELERSESFATWRLANAIRQCQIATGEVVKSAVQKLKQLININGEEK